MEAHGFGAVLAVEPGASVPQLEAASWREARQWRGRPLAAYSHEWHFLPQQIVEIAATKPAAPRAGGHGRIPAGEFDFQVSGIEIEGYNWEGRGRAVSVGALAAPAPRAHRFTSSVSISTAIR